jgi:hypothetical protein
MSGAQEKPLNEYVMIPNAQRINAFAFAMEWIG